MHLPVEDQSSLTTSARTPLLCWRGWELESRAPRRHAPCLDKFIAGTAKKSNLSQKAVHEIFCTHVENIDLQSADRSTQLTQTPGCKHQCQS